MKGVKVWQFAAPSANLEKCLLDDKGLNVTHSRDHNLSMFLGILEGHIVRSTYFDDSLYDGLVFDTLGYGRSIKITVRPDGSKYISLPLPVFLYSQIRTVLSSTRTTLLAKYL